ncbi:hypothetical protein [Candidatus Magnetobacterium casense]|uniref:DUF6242 domain-containing protein n=1 Tax=Candidatus Magnetobacterium casense TaxID=1455061 RepID=A0ABS6S152_9BACT|nr:hypothetical protein [Candidatus Magnetobacterium casensis]MBV6342128.1 hypothetical protein [Candidatus Magnetobacterium casensis]
MIEKTKEILHVCIALLLITCLPLSAYPDAVDNWHWRSPFPYANHDLSAVCYGNGTFVAVGDKGTILTSPDGVTWTKGTFTAKDWLRGVVYGNNTFVAVGDKGTILNSPDGAAWTKGTSTSELCP